MSKPKDDDVSDVIALADDAYMPDEGRRILLATTPEGRRLRRCRRRVRERLPRGTPVKAVPEGEEFELAGCYVGDGRGGGVIFLAAPEHPSFYDGVVTTAAHEMLHAAWEQLDVRERAELRDLLEAEVADLDADDPIHEQIEWSTDGSKMARPSELFAYVGTQIWREGGLEPQLEEVYARFISDRSALVAVHTDNPFG